MKFVVPLKLSTVWFNVSITPPSNTEPPNAQLSRKVVFPLNVRLLLIAPPNAIQWPLLCVNSVIPARVMSVLFTTSTVAGLSWKEQLTSSVRCVDCKSRAA